MRNGKWKVTWREEKGTMDGTVWPSFHREVGSLQEADELEEALKKRGCRDIHINITWPAIKGDP